jgi:TonB family protein
MSGRNAVYPAIAALAHVEGCVYLSIVVAADGSVKQLVFVSGPALLRQSAMDAVKTWRFKPSTQEVSTVSPVCYFLSVSNREKLLSSYQETARKNARNPKKLTALGLDLLHAGLPDEADAQFHRALSLKPGDADAEFGLGDSLAAQGNFSDAIAAYQQGLAANPKDPWPRSHLAELLENNGDDDGAIAQYRILLQTDTKGSMYIGNYRLSLARLLLKKGDTDGAIEQYQEAIHAQPDNPSFHYGLGEAFEKKRNTADALKEYKTATKLMPENTEFRDAYNRLASK